MTRLLLSICVSALVCSSAVLFARHPNAAAAGAPDAAPASGWRALGAPPQGPKALLDRAVDEFAEGRFAQSAATFDEAAKMIPNEAPYLWQRGIALYYAGRYGDCRRQFESHRTVNPDDVENAAWHFLCVAREQTPEKARGALLPVGLDPRAPMREVYQMFRGTLTAEDVLKAAGSGASGQFYAHLYIGLYSEALGRKDLALKHIKEAASDRYAPVGGYMHMVAVVHLKVLGP